MKKVFTLAVLAFLITTANPYRANATFPGESIVFWDSALSDEKKDPEIMQAFKLAGEKKYAQALKILNEKIEKSPKHTTLHVMKGLVLNEMEIYDQARLSLNAAQMIEGRHPGIHYGFCEVYRNMGVSDLAERACRVAEEIHIRSPEAHYEYAQILAATGQMMQAIRSLASAAELDPKNPKYHYERGMNFYYLNQYDEAEKSFQKALSLDPAHVDSGYQLAYLYAARKKSGLAKQQIERVLATGKEHPKVQSAKLLLEYVNKNALDKLPLKIVPHEYHVGRSKSLYQAGQYGLALIEIETAARLKPDDLKIGEVLIGLTGFLLRLDKTEKAVKNLIRVAGETDILTAKGYQVLGDVEVMRSHLSEARKYYEKALNLNDPNGIARQSLNELPEKADPGTAPLGLDELFVHPVEALNRKGEIFAQYKMFKRATSMYALVLRMKPNHLPALLNTATAYYHSGDYDRTISILERLLLSHPNHKDIISHRILLAQAYVKNEDHGKGLQNIEIAIKLNPAVKKAIQTNPAFDSIRKMKEYKQMIQ
ncbi:hypothetical protein UZ36_07640 [Candidatus Nitromaritima sp. SCGC AAA799-C22]|nr:hypothetical protein UZ36_07640 [Candidatus Nitromaritima sp. SCGC AAA799-C22]